MVWGAVEAGDSLCYAGYSIDLNRKGQSPMYRTEYDAPLGKLTLAGDERGLRGLWLEGQKYFGAPGAGARRRMTWRAWRPPGGGWMTISPGGGPIPVRCRWSRRDRLPEADLGAAAGDPLGEKW